MAANKRTWVTIGLVTAALGLFVLSGTLSAFPLGTNVAAPEASTPAPVGASPATATNTAGASAHLPTPIRHVFLIMMENEETAIIYGNQPYETKLANTYAWGGDANNPDKVGYYANCHPSAPNYLALTSGQTLQCGSDSYNTYNVTNLGTLLDAQNESWIAYEESANVACQTYNSGLYVVRHNPFPFYSNLGPNTTATSPCDSHDVPIANLTQDYPYSATPPAFTYIAPNILNDGHSSSAATGDHWLSTFVPKLIAEPWFQSSVILITYDEAYAPNGNWNSTGYDWLWGGPVYTVAVSPYTVGVGALDTNTSHFNLLTTIEFLLGLPSTGTGHDGTALFPTMTGLFQPRLFGPGANLADSNLQYTNLSGYDLAGDNLAGANLRGIDLVGADLRGANLQGADLKGADLQGADLRGANVQYGDLRGADLSGANFRGADLQWAHLGVTTLTGLGAPRNLNTNFDGADLAHAILAGAICGSPNYIVANGATLSGTIGIPAACQPPL
jgi:phosphatidylinositol-3-phosphatase